MFRHCNHARSDSIAPFLPNLGIRVIKWLDSHAGRFKPEMPPIRITCEARWTTELVQTHWKTRYFPYIRLDSNHSSLLVQPAAQAFHWLLFPNSHPIKALSSNIVINMFNFHNLGVHTGNSSRMDRSAGTIRSIYPMMSSSSFFGVLGYREIHVRGQTTV